MAWHRNFISDAGRTPSLFGISYNRFLPISISPFSLNVFRSAYVPAIAYYLLRSYIFVESRPTRSNVAWPLPLVVPVPRNFNVGGSKYRVSCVAAHRSAFVKTTADKDTRVPAVTLVKAGRMGQSLFITYASGAL